MNTRNPDPTSEAPAAIQQQQTDSPEPKRILAGLQASRLVWYVLLDLSVRPFLILDALDGTGTVLGILFFNRIQDERQLPVPCTVDDTGHKPACAMVLTVEYSEEGAAGSWMWPTKQPVMAANVDANAVNMAIDAYIEPVVARVTATFKQLLDDRLKAQDEAVQALLNSHSELLKDTVAKMQNQIIPFPVLGDGHLLESESATRTATGADLAMRGGSLGASGTGAVADPTPQTGEQTQANQAADAGTQAAEQSGGKETATAGS